MWELDYKESWVLKNWWLWTVVLERLLRVPWTARRSNQSVLREIKGIFIGRTDAETSILWPPDVRNWLWCWERLKAGGEGTDRGWDGWIASLTQRTWVWASSRRWWGQGSLACCSPWGRKELDTTEWLKNDLPFYLSELPRSVVPNDTYVGRIL